MKKVLLTILGVFLVIMIVGAILVYTNKDKLTDLVVEKGFGAMKEAVIKNIPSNVSSNDVTVLFDKAVIKIKSGEFDKNKMQVIATNFQVSFQDQKFDSAEIVLIMNSLTDFVED